MKKAFGFMALSLLMLSSCETLKQTAKTADVNASLQSVAVADLKVTDHRVTATMDVTPEVRRGGMSNIKQAVEAKALDENGNADVLLEPQYVIEKRRNLFGSKVTKISVSGRPAFYTGFRTLNDSVWCNPVFRGVKYIYSGSSNPQRMEKTSEYANAFAAANSFRKKGFAAYLTLTGGWSKERLDEGDEDELYDDESNFGATFSFGYQLNPHWFIGIGTGVHYFHYDEGCLIPLFGEVRYNFFNRKNTPFLDYRIGGTFVVGNWEEGVYCSDVSGGNYGAISLGYSFGNVDLAFTYMAMNINREYSNYYYGGWESHDADFRIENVNLSIGFRF